MNISGKLPRWQILGLALLGGVVLAASAPYFPWHWLSGLVLGLGEALFVFAFLAFTVERWFRQEFATDVFYAGLGANLRPEFHEELRWLTSFKWLAIKTECHVKLDDLGNDVVRLTITIKKEFENISPDTEKFRAALGVDDWTIPGHKSSIEQCAIQKVGGEIVNADEKEIKPVHIAAFSKEISVEPKGRVKSFAKSVEYRHRNDISIVAFSYPSKDPEIEVEAPPTLIAEGGFSHRGKMDTEAFTGKKTLRGTYLPSQMMVIRWYPKDIT